MKKELVLDTNVIVNGKVDCDLLVEQLIKIIKYYHIVESSTYELVKKYIELTNVNDKTFLDSNLLMNVNYQLYEKLENNNYLVKSRYQDEVLGMPYHIDNIYIDSSSRKTLFEITKWTFFSKESLTILCDGTVISKGDVYDRGLNHNKRITLDDKTLEKIINVVFNNHMLDVKEIELIEESEMCYLDGPSFDVKLIANNYKVNYGLNQLDNTDKTNAYDFFKGLEKIKRILKSNSVVTSVFDND